jgi:CSLREA domain-containing protein
MPRNIITNAGIAALLLFGGDQMARAAYFTVDSTTDTVDVNPGDGIAADANGHCTLRAAIMEANALPGPDTISLPANTYTLTIAGRGEDAAAKGDLDIAGDLTIYGAGAALTIIDGAGLDRVFHILDGATVQIRGVTIRGGDPGTSAGGIWNSGTLALTSSTVTANTGTDFAGGIYSRGTLILTRCTVSGNTMLGSISGGGGGIYNEGTMTVISCTFNGNTTLGRGGAIYNYQTATVTNSTLSGNTARNGGGIFNLGSVMVTHGTITLNTATDTGGGLWNYSGTMKLANTIIGDNVAATQSPNCATSVTSLGCNLSSDASCGLTDPTDLINPALGLAPLADNGGPTKTHALLAISPAINLVTHAHQAVSTDQRGAPRSQLGTCASGAFEVGCSFPPRNMVAWWQLDETAGTTVAERVVPNNGTATPGAIGSGTGPAPVLGQVGGALYFDSSAPYYVSVANAETLNFGTGDLSIDAWVKVPAQSSIYRHPVVHKYAWAVNKGYYLSLASIQPNGAEVVFVMGDGALAQYVTGNNLLVPYDTWTHIAVTVSRVKGTPTVTFYINGSPVTLTSPALPLSSIDNTSPVLIGYSSEPGPGLKPVSVDELELFNRALTQQEIQSIIAYGKCQCLQLAPPRIAYSYVYGAITLAWPGCCTLLEANQLSGPWTDVPIAYSPFTIQPLAKQKFYRLWSN